MNTYHKINTIFKRDPDTNKIMYGEFSRPEFSYLSGNTWIGTEKIDGTNIRVIFNGAYDSMSVKFRGKTDNAELPKVLLKKLNELFNVDKLFDVFGGHNVCLYGEGYGNKIQGCGKRYIAEDNDFILFDVKIGDWWLESSNVADISNKLSIKMVPQVFCGTIFEAIERVKQGENSLISEDRTLLSEGLILKPTTELFDRRGERVITKIKYKDFKE